MPTAAQAKILTRKVPAFSTQATQKHVRVQPPPRPDASGPRRPSKPTAFRRFYERGDFPIALEFDTFGHKIAWKVGVLLLLF
jgi:Parkin co-regulated protein